MHEKPAYWKWTLILAAVTTLFVSACVKTPLVAPMPVGVTGDAVWVSWGTSLFRCEHPGERKPPHCLQAAFFYTTK